MPSALAGRAMLVALHMSAWEGRRQDKKLGKEAEEKHEMESGTVKALKYLVPKEALDPITKLHGEARALFYKHSLSWGDNGVRIISSANYVDPFVPAMNEIMERCRVAYRVFVKGYPKLLEDAPIRLNGRFRLQDFPPVNKIEKRFGIRIDILPLPETEDFRVVDLGVAQSEAEEAVREALMRNNQEALSEVYERVMEPLRHFAQTMREGGVHPKTKTALFKDSTVEKVIEAARAMPRLSLVPDPKLEAECAAIIKELGGIDPQDLRKKPKARTKAAEQAEARLSQIENAMKAFGLSAV